MWTTTQELTGSLHPTRRWHFEFPTCAVGDAVARCEQVLVGKGWVAAAGQPPPVRTEGTRLWWHERGPGLLLVIAARTPPVVSLGWLRPGAAPDGRGASAWRVYRGMRSIAGELRKLGGRWIGDKHLGTVVGQAVQRDRLAEALTAQLTDLRSQLERRPCPACGAWSRVDARWCRRCETEFTVTDNQARDAHTLTTHRTLAGLTTQIEGLRRGVTR